MEITRSSGKSHTGRAYRYVPVRFELWNYYIPEELDNHIGQDPWTGRDKFSFDNFLESLVFESFPFFRVIAAIKNQRGNLPFGYDSSTLQPVRSKDEFRSLLGKDYPCLFLPKRFEHLCSSFSDSFDDFEIKHFLHIFPVEGESLQNPVVVQYESSNSWWVHEYDWKDNQFNWSFITGHSGDKFFLLEKSKKYFIIPLPYPLTRDGVDYLKSL